MFSIGDGFEATVFAQTGEQFCNFSPYVASINDHGTVSFQAELRHGHTGIFCYDNQTLSTIMDSTHGFFRHFYSHPDIDNYGSICFYAELQTCVQSICVKRGDEWVSLARADDGFFSVGPLGPTIHDSGMVAFRAERTSGIPGIFASDGKQIIPISDTASDPFVGYFGLPVIYREGTVFFRAEKKNGVQGIYATTSEGKLATIAETPAQFRSLGNFPMITKHGTVVFNGILATGEGGIFAVDGGVITTLHSDPSFASYRGALMNGLGQFVFYATPQGGDLGIYQGIDARKILAIGDPLLDSFVLEFALNPVSINNIGQIVVRVKLANQRQLFLLVTMDANS